MTRSDHPKAGGRWLVTERTAPAWAAVLELFSDQQTRQLDDVQRAMREAAGLADRTIANHLRSASRRGWVSVRQGTVTIRDRDLIQAELEALR